MKLKKYFSLYILTVFLALPVGNYVANAQDGSMSDSFLLLRSIKEKDYGKVRSYLQKGANVNTRDYSDGATPLFIATRMKDTVMVTFLLNSKAKTDIALKSTGETPLMLAVRLKAREIVKMLIAQKADLDIKDRNGETALYKAVQGNDRDSTKALLAANADWSLTDNTGRTPLDLTLEDRRLRSMIRILENAGAEY